MASDGKSDPPLGAPGTIFEIEARIARGRQRYLAAYFSGDEGQAQFWVREIIRLQNHRNLLERRAAS